jgi:hypothetical protein
MDKPSWKDIVEFIGIGAIVASLIFVGLELQQQQQIALAAQYQERLRTGFDYFFSVSEKPVWQQRTAERLRHQYNFSRLSRADRELLENGSPRDISDWFVSAQINLLIFDNQYFQYESGFSSEEAWQNQRERLKWVLQTNSFTRQEIRIFGSRFRPSFVDVANRLIDEIESGDEK